MIASVLFDYWAFLLREPWFFFYTYFNLWLCPLFSLELRWAFWEETSSRSPPLPQWRWLRRQRRSVEPEIYVLEGDWLVPSLVLMYGWQSPPPNPLHLLTHIHTIQHTATHASRHCSGPQASFDSPSELLHVKLQQTDCCFFFFYFLLSIDNSINHHVQTTPEGMCLCACVLLLSALAFVFALRMVSQTGDEVEWLYGCAVWSCRVTGLDCALNPCQLRCPSAGVCLSFSAQSREAGSCRHAFPIKSLVRNLTHKTQSRPMLSYQMKPWSSDLVSVLLMFLFLLLLFFFLLQVGRRTPPTVLLCTLRHAGLSAEEAEPSTPAPGVCQQDPGAAASPWTEM